MISFFNTKIISYLIWTFHLNYHRDAFSIQQEYFISHHNTGSVVWIRHASLLYFATFGLWCGIPSSTLVYISMSVPLNWYSFMVYYVRLYAALKVNKNQVRSFGIRKMDLGFLKLFVFRENRFLKFGYFEVFPDLWESISIKLCLNISFSMTNLK